MEKEALLSVSQRPQLRDLFSSMPFRIEKLEKYETLIYTVFSRTMRPLKPAGYGAEEIATILEVKT
jgi:hypothetical protein